MDKSSVGRSGDYGLLIVNNIKVGGFIQWTIGLKPVKTGTAPKSVWFASAKTWWLNDKIDGNKCLAKFFVIENNEEVLIASENVIIFPGSNELNKLITSNFMIEKQEN
ncbi:MAG: hypothetical protein OEY10_00390 [Nitrosopumilus sp.]|nr:hypothetical protein [Nitrosopumilus sp.]